MQTAAFPLLRKLSLWGEVASRSDDGEGLPEANLFA